MLMGSKAGRSASRVLTQLTGNADKLADAFNIEIDITKPLDLVDILEQLNVRLAENQVNGKLTAETFDKLQDVFGQVGKRAAVALIQNVEELKDSIDDMKLTKFDGLADKMAKIRLDTLQADMDKLSATFKVFLADNLEPFLLAFQKITTTVKSIIGWLTKGTSEISGFIGSIVGIASVVGILKGVQVIFSKLILQQEKAGSLIAWVGRAFITLARTVFHLKTTLLAFGATLAKVYFHVRGTITSMVHLSSVIKILGKDAMLAKAAFTGWGIVIGLVVAAGYVLYRQYKRQQEALHRVTQELDDARTAYQNAVADINNYAEGLKTIIEQYKDAIPYTDKWNKLREKLSDTYPTILGHLDREVALTGEGTETLRQYVHAKERELAVSQQLNDVREKSNEQMELTNEKLEYVLGKQKTPIETGTSAVQYLPAVRAGIASAIRPNTGSMEDQIPY